MKWLLFAWKNVLRNRRRTAITILLAALGTASVLLATGFAMYVYDALKQISASQVGHVVVAHHDYFESSEQSPLQHGLDEPERLTRELLADPRVATVLPRVEFSGLVTNGEKSAIFIGSGVEPEGEFRINGLNLKVERGRPLAASTVAGHDPQVMIGKDLARDLRADVGATLTLLSTTTQGALNGIDVEVVGIYATGTPEMDARAVMVPIGTAQALVQSARVSTLSAYLGKIENAAAVKDDFARGHPTLALRTWEDLAFFYTKVRELYNRIFGVLGIIIVVMVFFAVTNTMSMAVAERTREIGTLAALGTSPARIVANFALEAGIIGAVSVVAGMALAGMVSILMHFFTVMMPAPPGRTDGYPLYFHFEPAVHAVVATAIFVAAVTAAILAARRGAGRPIVEALQHV